MVVDDIYMRNGRQIEGAVLTVGTHMIKVKTEWYRQKHAELHDPRMANFALGHSDKAAERRKAFFRHDPRYRLALHWFPVTVDPRVLFGLVPGLCKIEQIIQANGEPRMTILTFRQQLATQLALGTIDFNQLLRLDPNMTPVTAHPATSARTCTGRTGEHVAVMHEPKR